MLFAYEIRCSYFFCGSFLKSYTLRKVEKKFVPFRKTRTIFVYSLFCFFFSLSNLKLERTKDQRQLSILSVMNVILVQFYLLIVSNKPAISRLSFDPWLSYLPRSNGVGNLSATKSRWFFFPGAKPTGHGDVDRAVLLKRTTQKSVSNCQPKRLSCSWKHTRVINWALVLRGKFHFKLFEYFILWNEVSADK